MAMDLSPLSRHERIALQFSGGKDSLAVALLLRPYWNRIAFYHVDAGDLLPEVRSIVDDFAQRVPRFVRITTDSRSWMEGKGLPCDLVPHTGTPAGQMVGHGRAITGRYECCNANLWVPMMRRTLDDGITLVIRGTKRADLDKLPASNGNAGPFELWLPLLDWSHDDVMAYLREQGQPVARLYSHAVNAPECATCPAWSTERRARYLRTFYPDLHDEYAAKLRAVAAEVTPVFDQMRAELDALDGGA